MISYPWYLSALRFVWHSIWRKFTPQVRPFFRFTDQNIYIVRASEFLQVQQVDRFVFNRSHRWYRSNASYVLRKYSKLLRTLRQVEKGAVLRRIPRVSGYVTSKILWRRRETMVLGRRVSNLLSQTCEACVSMKRCRVLSIGPWTLILARRFSAWCCQTCRVLNPRLFAEIESQSGTKNVLFGTFRIKRNTDPPTDRTNRVILPTNNNFVVHGRPRDRFDAIALRR